MKERKLRFDGELCFVRFGRDGEVMHIAVYGGTTLSAGDFSIALNKDAGFVEVVIKGKRAIVLAGELKDVSEIKVRGKNIGIE